MISWDFSLHPLICYSLLTAYSSEHVEPGFSVVFCGQDVVLCGQEIADNPLISPFSASVSFACICKLTGTSDVELQLYSTPNPSATCVRITPGY
jgi:hypothetical protein